MLDGVNNHLGTNTQYLALLIDSPCVSSPMLQPDDIVLDSNHTWDLSKKFRNHSFWGKKITTKTRHLLICDKCANGLKWDQTNKKPFFTLNCLCQQVYRILHCKCVNVSHKMAKFTLSVKRNTQKGPTLIRMYIREPVKNVLADFVR